MEKKKLKTIDLKGKEYVQVAERIRAIHEDHKNFNIETVFSVTDAGNIVFTATLTIRDKVENDCVVFTGHSFGTVGKDKAFEKLETIAVGRALAFAGYLADGDIASADEMQNTGGDKKSQDEIPEDLKKKISEATTVKEIEDIYRENSKYGKGLIALCGEHKKFIMNADKEVVPEE